MGAKGGLKAEILYEAKAVLGEGPVWDHLAQKLYWVDIEGCRLHCYMPENKTYLSWEFDGMLGAVIPSEDGSLILAHERDLLRFNPINEKKEMLGLLPNTNQRLRFNDGKCDPQGNLWIGTMDKKLAPKAGNLYRVDPHGNARVVLKGTTISNGMAWTHDQDHYFYIDSDAYELWRFNYQPEEGSIGNKKVAFGIPRDFGAADGMSIDREGKLWIAHWGGHCIRRWDPDTGEVLQKIEVAAPHVTSCCFGGKEMDTLFITTARSGLNREQLEEYPLSGGLFSYTPGVEGLPANHFNLNRDR